MESPAKQKASTPESGKQTDGERRDSSDGSISFIERFFVADHHQRDESATFHPQG
jgi:hypothetical protein